jgi:hypothetical protein
MIVEEEHTRGFAYRTGMWINWETRFDEDSKQTALPSTNGTGHEPAETALRISSFSKFKDDFFAKRSLSLLLAIIISLLYWPCPYSKGVDAIRRFIHSAVPQWPVLVQ